MAEGETGAITGTPDKDYNIIWFTEACLSNALRLEVYAQGAERSGDGELAECFRRAPGERAPRAVGRRRGGGGGAAYPPLGGRCWLCSSSRSARSVSCCSRWCAA